MAAEDPKTNVNLNFILDCLSQNRHELSIDFQAAADKVGMTLARNTEMAPKVDSKEEPNFLFAIAVSSTCGEFKPDYEKVCQKVGIAHARTVQQKFKKLIESTGKYALVNGKVTDLEEDPNAAPPSTPAKRGRGGKAAGGTPRTTSGRKRKTPKNKEDSDENDSDAEGTPPKKRATTKRTAAKAAADKVKEEASDGDGEAGEKNGDGDVGGSKEDSDDDLGDYKDPKLGGAGRVDNSDEI